MIASLLFAAALSSSNGTTQDVWPDRFDLRCRITGAAGFKWMNGGWTSTATAQDGFAIAVDTERRTAALGDDVLTLETRSASLVMTSPSTMTASVQIVYFGDRTENSGPMSLILAVPSMMGGGHPSVLAHVGVCDVVRDENQRTIP